MKIEIVGAESLGVRGLCCFITTEYQKIVIDPGIALGYTRYKLLPHPFQVAVDEKIQKKIIKAYSEATDIVISHFHGDHIPLVNANPYQLNTENIAGLNPKVTIWAKLSKLSPTEKKRAESLSLAIKKNLIQAEGIAQGVFHFSKAVPHGKPDNNLETVMMTKIEEDSVFVHASDIQLLNNESISQIISWKPDIVLASGPPLYLFKLSKDQIRKAWQNALWLSESIDTLIIDHHLLRDDIGIRWLKKLSSKSNNNILCGADFMNKPQMLLEARRKDLYEQMPVPEGWHEAYGQGQVTTDYYWNLAKNYYNNLESYNEK